MLIFFCSFPIGFDINTSYADQIAGEEGFEPP